MIIKKRLLWVNIIGKSIHALAPKIFDYQRWDTDDFVTSWGLSKDGGVNSINEDRFG